MRFNANRNRDPFMFSRARMAAINPYVIVPAIADDRMRKPVGQPSALDGEGRARTAVGVENFLARYFAPGCCGAA